MAKNETIRVTQKTQTDDINAFDALNDISDYNPANPNFTIANGNSAKDNMIKLQAAETQANAAAKAARDNAVAAEWDFHNFILGAKTQVIAQYGDSSNQIQGMGLKKKTEYKKRGGKKPPPATPKP
jgi:hypothetical protein